MHILREGIEGSTRWKSFSVVRLYSLSCGGKFPMVHERSALIVKAPEFTGNEFAMPSKKSWRSRWLVLIEWLTFRIGLWITRRADVVQLEVRVCRNHDYTIRIWPQARLRQFSVCQIHSE